MRLSRARPRVLLTVLQRPARRSAGSAVRPELSARKKDAHCCRDFILPAASLSSASLVPGGPAEAATFWPQTFARGGFDSFRAAVLLGNCRCRARASDLVFANAPRTTGGEPREDIGLGWAIQEKSWGVCGLNARRYAKSPADSRLGRVIGRWSVVLQVYRLGHAQFAQPATVAMSNYKRKSAQMISIGYVVIQMSICSKRSRMRALNSVKNTRVSGVSATSTNVRIRSSRKT